MPATVDAIAPITTTISRPVVKKCPHRDETDAGTLTLTFDGEAPELHDLAAKIDALCARPISHEAFTQAVAVLLRMRSNQPVAVVAEWHTGPWTVKVAAQ